MFLMLRPAVGAVREFCSGVVCLSSDRCGSARRRERVNGEPDRRSEVIGPFDAMTDMRAQDHVMAGMEVDGVRVALDAETGSAA